ncbi:hypothetical protein [Cupriavidus necator]
MNAVSIFFLQAMLVVALPYLLWRGAGLQSVFPLVVCVKRIASYSAWRGRV